MHSVNCQNNGEPQAPACLQPLPPALPTLQRNQQPLQWNSHLLMNPITATRKENLPRPPPRAAPATPSPQRDENLGSWLPRMTLRSTPSFVIAARRITPPLEPSRSMARASAATERGCERVCSWGGGRPEVWLQGTLLTRSCEIQAFFFAHARLVGGVHKTVDVGAAGAPDGEGLPNHHPTHGD